MNDIWRTIHFHCDDFRSARHLLQTCRKVHYNVSKQDIHLGHIRRFLVLLYKNRKAYSHDLKDDLPIALEKCLEWAAKHSCLPIVHHLLEKKVHVTTTALVNAVQNGRKDIVKELVHTGIDVSALDNWALRTAALAGHDDIVQFLLAHGANAQSGMYEALLMNNEKIIKTLLQHGAKATPLHLETAIWNKVHLVQISGNRDL
jgi:hypothetical protein